MKHFLFHAIFLFVLADSISAQQRNYDFCKEKIYEVLQKDSFTIFYHKEYIPNQIIVFLEQQKIKFINTQDYNFPDAQMWQNKLFYVAISSNYYFVALCYGFSNYSYFFFEISQSNIVNIGYTSYFGGFKSFLSMKSFIKKGDMIYFFCEKKKHINRFNILYSKYKKESSIKKEMMDTLINLKLTYLDSIKLLYSLDYEERIKRDSLFGNYIPKNILECFKYLDEFILSDKEKLYLKSASIDQTLWLHSGMIRNRWELYQGSRLKQYFMDRGIVSPYIISYMIIDFYKDYLNENNTSWQEFDKMK